jgi:hypothetical protein
MPTQCVWLDFKGDILFYPYLTILHHGILCFPENSRRSTYEPYYFIIG